jgi:hypothetical protein
MSHPARLDHFHLDGLLGLVRAGQLPVEQAIQDIMARPLLARGALERGMVNVKAMTSRAELYTQLVAWFAKGVS